MDVTENSDDAAPTAEELARSERAFRVLDIAVAALFLFIGIVEIGRAHV